MKTFKNINFVKRDYECINVVFAQAESNPDEKIWKEVEASELENSTCMELWTDYEGNIRTKKFGYM